MNPGEIEFLSDGAPGKPLIYVRSCEGERILVVLNPTEEDHELKDVQPKELLYVLGEKPESTDDKLTIKKDSAFFAGL